jgi:hypothetical protein
VSRPEGLDELCGRLVERAGGYLRNTVRIDGVTCAVCTTPTFGYPRCFPCHRHTRSGEHLADAVGPLVYAVKGQQSAYMMRNYKGGRPIAEHRLTVTLLCLLAMRLHNRCAGILAHAPVTHWSTVPSLPAKSGEHPLHRVVSRIAPGEEVPLLAATATPGPREVHSDHFRVPGDVPGDAHVLLLDDTWTRGGHAQSAALALRTAGAQRVSVLVVARWLNPDFGDTGDFIGEHLRRDYDPGICPWTGGTCP